MAMAHTFTAVQASERTVSMKFQQEENDAKEPEARERKRLQNRVAQRTYRKAIVSFCLSQLAATNLRLCHLQEKTRKNDYAC
jgi:hypothetical protein